MNYIFCTFCWSIAHYHNWNISSLYMLYMYIVFRKYEDIFAVFIQIVDVLAQYWTCRLGYLCDGIYCLKCISCDYTAVCVYSAFQISIRDICLPGSSHWYSLWFYHSLLSLWNATQHHQSVALLPLCATKTPNQYFLHIQWSFNVKRRSTLFHLNGSSYA